MGGSIVGNSSFGGDTTGAVCEHEKTTRECDFARFAQPPRRNRGSVGLEDATMVVSRKEDLLGREASFVPNDEALAFIFLICKLQEQGSTIPVASADGSVGPCSAAHPVI